MRGDVLIVDDDQDLCEALKAVLVESNCFRHVVMAKDGTEALKKIQIQQFVLVITDLSMPRTDGLNLINNIIFGRPKGGIDNSKVPIIALSGNLTSENVKAAITLGVRSILAKPFKSDELLAKIKSLL